MLERYHWGAYGSKTTGRWSCCEKSEMDAQGCKNAVATSTRKDSQTSVKSDDTLKNDLGSSTSSLRHSSSCDSDLSKSLL